MDKSVKKLKTFSIAMYCKWYFNFDLIGFLKRFFKKPIMVIFLDSKNKLLILCFEG